MGRSLRAVNDPSVSNKKWQALQQQNRAKKQPKGKAVLTAGRQSQPQATAKPALTYCNDYAKPTDASLSQKKTPPEDQGSIGVYYGRTDNTTTGYKEYTCVVLRTNETDIRYYDDLYEPIPGCNYKILYELPMKELHRMIKEEGEDRLNMVGWVTGSLKDCVLKKWKESNGGS